jgi:hypothetical protein
VEGDDSTKSAHEFERIAGRFLGEPGVSQGTGFGSNPGLRVEGKVFAMLARGDLVAKLPKERVDELVAADTAERFDAGKGRPMREWARVPPRRHDAWEGLAAEAFRFVAGRPCASSASPDAP